MNWLHSLKGNTAGGAGGLSDWRRSAVVGFGAAVLCLAVVVWVRMSPEPREALFEGWRFRDTELVSLQTAFAACNLDDWECQEGRILVPRGQRSEYLKAAAKADALPVQLHAPPNMALQASLLDSRETRDEKRRQNLQSELVRLVQALRGVQEATVRYSEQTLAGLHRKIERRALVAVRCVNEAPLSGMQIHTIRRTMVAAVAGLRAEDVTVTDLNHATAWSGVPDVPTPVSIPTAEPSGRPGADRMTSRRPALDRRQLALQWSGQLTDQLNGLQGVQVHVELPELSTPAARPVVHVRGDVNLAVKVQLPLQTLRQHYGSVTMDATQLPQVAAERLQPIIESVTQRPTAVFVSLAPQPTTTTDVQPTPPSSHVAANQTKLAVGQQDPRRRDKAANDTPRKGQTAEGQTAEGQTTEGQTTEGQPTVMRLITEADSGSYQNPLGRWTLGIFGLVATCWVVLRNHRGRGFELDEPETHAEDDQRTRVSLTEASAGRGANSTEELEADAHDQGRRRTPSLLSDKAITSCSDAKEEAWNENNCHQNEPVLGDDCPLWIETLERERPQVIAAMLSQMPPLDAAAILDGMCDDVRSDVLRRISSLGDVSPDVRELMCSSLAASLETRRQARMRRAHGEAAVQAILDARAVTADAEPVEHASAIDHDRPQDSMDTAVTSRGGASDLPSCGEARTLNLEEALPTASRALARGRLQSSVTGAVTDQPTSPSSLHDMGIDLHDGRQL